jgi:beta-1,4-N-acetylglucosaminyltransferase
MPITVILLAGLCIWLIRWYSRARRPNANFKDTRSLAVFLGSGGHTSEALMLLSSVDFNRYRPRTYVISEGDTLSAQKAASFEAVKAANSNSINHDNYTLLTIPRARRVHQSLLTTPPTALTSLLACVYLVTISPLLSPKAPRSIVADVLILNGPGTCLVLCGAVYFNRLLGFPSPKLIYVESFARVRSLSLSGKLLRPFVDRFIVQWPELLKDQGRGEYRGFLV